jgi:hypothetical protein
LCFFGPAQLPRSEGNAASFPVPGPQARQPNHEAFKRQAMRILLSVLSFAFEMLAALIAFSYTVISFPLTTRVLLAGINAFRDQLLPLFLPETYKAMADIALWPSLILFAGFAICVHFAMDLMRTIFNNWRFPGEPDRS